MMRYHNPCEPRIRIKRPGKVARWVAAAVLVVVAVVLLCWVASLELPPPA